MKEVNKLTKHDRQVRQKEHKIHEVALPREDRCGHLFEYRVASTMKDVRRAVLCVKERCTVKVKVWRAFPLQSSAR